MSSSARPVATPVAEYSSDLPNTGWGAWLGSIARALNLVLGGKLNVTTSITLTASATTTTLYDSRIGYYSFIGLMPTTANAAHEIALSAGIYITPGDGSAVITHSNNASADKTYTVLIIG
jgi:hypothetical protein